jgi:predicted permease
MFTDLYFALLTTFPIFFIIVLGVLFRRIDWLSDEFVQLGSRLVFNVSLPCLLFVKIVETDFRHGFPLELILAALVSTIVVFVLIDRCLAPLLARPYDRGAFVQGTFRSNMGIVGLAYCLSAFGEGVVAKASIYLAMMTILYNVLSVLTLSRHQESDAQGDLLKVFGNILKNPLILSICGALLISLSGTPVPGIVMETGGYFARMALPLALLCTGASIRMQDFQASRSLYWAVSAKLLFVPLLTTLGGIAAGLRGDSLGVLFLMSAAPTAATSLGSLISTALGLFVLRVAALI